MSGQTVSRRSVFGFFASLTGYFALAGSALAQQKASQAEAKYQNMPKGQQRCAICVNFEPPNQCRFVVGPVSPQGWCQFFAARENTR